MIMGGASDMLTGITGIYMGTFVGLHLAKKLYAILEPKIGRKNNQEVINGQKILLDTAA